MVIENYMPDFAVEAVYDLTVPSLQAQIPLRNASKEQLRSLELITSIGL